MRAQLILATNNPGYLADLKNGLVNKKQEWIDAANQFNSTVLLPHLAGRAVVASPCLR
ncbi:MAG: hypothetical protein AAF549_00870 [Pseudomonadota bacterium]